MVRRTKEEALVTRDQILDAAERVFHERGVSRTTLHEIAEAAGVTRGAIYWHFEDKADVFNAMMQRVTLPLEEEAAQGEFKSTDPLVAVRKNFTDALRKTVNDPQARRVFDIAMHKVEYVDELHAVRERRLSTRSQCLARTERGLKRAAQNGQIGRRLSARSAAFGLHALISGLIQNWMLDPEAFDLVRVGQQVLDTYLAGLADSPSARS